ncbi:MAG: hypothetical protein ABEJ70_04705 [Halobacteriaceae archaeon]
MSDPEATSPDATAPDVPDWDDEYVDRVSDRLMASYDLEKDRTVRGEPFTLYGEMRVVSQKHFFHPALRYGRHETHDHLFVRRVDDVTVADLEALVEVGHALADDWIEADEQHFGTDFTFVLVTDAIPDDVRAFVDGFRDRTLIRYGYHGHYEVNLGVVAPAVEESVATAEADVVSAFRLWESLDDGSNRRGLLGRLFS